MRKDSPTDLPNYEVAMRIARIVAEMPSHPFGWELSGIADYLDVHERTVRRYIKALGEEFINADGEPVFVIEKRGEVMKLVKQEPEREELPEGVYHLVSVHLALEFFRMLGQNVVAFSVEDVLNRAMKKLTPHERDLLRHVNRKFYTAPSAPKDYTGHEDIMEDVVKAIVYQRPLKMKYRRGGSDETWSYGVLPLTLLYHKGGFYLIAKPVNREKPAYFNIERIQSVEILPEKFDYPSDYHPDQMLDGAFGIFSGPARKFTLKFPAELADYVSSRTWHKSQQLKRLKDGSVILTLKVADTEEVRSWIRSFGRAVKLVGR